MGHLGLLIGGVGIDGPFDLKPCPAALAFRYAN